MTTPSDASPDKTPKPKPENAPDRPKSAEGEPRNPGPKAAGPEPVPQQKQNPNQPDKPSRLNVGPKPDGPKANPNAGPNAGRPRPAPQAGPNAGGPKAAPQAGPNAGSPRPAPQAGPNAGGPKAAPQAAPNAGRAPNAPANPNPAPKPNAPQAPQQPIYTPETVRSTPASTARMRGRHWGIIFSFLLHVLAPIGVVGWYLYDRAEDQYASTVGFSVRREEGGSGIELLAGLSAVGSSSSSDADILYEFIQSQKLVSDINAQIDLAAMWSVSHETDPYFAYNPDGTIEDLLNHWDRKVRIFYDGGTGLIEVRVLAFRAEDANAIARAIFDESSAMINALSDIARDDAIRYARTELEVAEARLLDARTAVTDFRNRNQIVDPSADLQNQSGLLGNLQAQLAEALIEVDLLTETTQSADPRIEQAQLRVRVIEDRIAVERRKMGIGDDGDARGGFASLVGEFERLTADREFAESAYTATLASFDAAQAEARRQTRYLAAHVQPTLAERAEYPQRFMLLALVAMFIFVIWSILVLVYYSLKDRR